MYCEKSSWNFEILARKAPAVAASGVGRELAAPARTDRLAGLCESQAGAHVPRRSAVAAAVDLGHAAGQRLEDLRHALASERAGAEEGAALLLCQRLRGKM